MILAGSTFRILLVLTVMASPFPAVPAGREDPDRTAGADTHAFSVHRGRAGGVTVLVDSWPAALHREDRWFPLPIAVGLDGEGDPVAFSPESFTLVDREGTEHAAVPYERLSSEYGKRDYDEALMRSRPMTLGSLSTKSRRIESSFYPPPGRGTRTPSVALWPLTWFRDVIYFPVPECGLEGEMVLRVSGEGMNRTLEVPIVVPPARTEGRENRK